MKHEDDSPLPRTLLETFGAIGTVSAALKTGIAKILKHTTFKKKEYMLQEGQTCQHIYFIEKGMARSFYIDQDKEITAWFMAENDFIISVKSFFLQVPSQENIQALEDMSVYYISFSDLMDLYEAHPDFNKIGRRLTEQYYIRAEERLQNIRKKEAAGRYRFLLAHHPEISQRVSSKIISSYLGITGETLSRIRAKRDSY